MYSSLPTHIPATDFLLPSASVFATASMLSLIASVTTDASPEIHGLCASSDFVDPVPVPDAVSVVDDELDPVDDDDGDEEDERERFANLHA